MANYKRKRTKKYWFPTCPYCMFKGPDGPSRSSGNHLRRGRSGMGRVPHRDWKQPQFWGDNAEVI